MKNPNGPIKKNKIKKEKMPRPQGYMNDHQP